MIPDVELELRKRNCKLAMACHLALMFHSGMEWTRGRKEIWDITMDTILGPVATRDRTVRVDNGDGTWGTLDITPTNETTTKNLCDAIRVALNQSTNQTNQTV